jgi:hypothetical protein
MPLTRAVAGARCAIFTVPSRDRPGAVYWILAIAHPPAEPSFDSIGTASAPILCRPGETWPAPSFYPHQIAIAEALKALAEGHPIAIGFQRQRDALAARARIERLR